MTSIWIVRIQNLNGRNLMRAFATHDAAKAWLNRHLYELPFGTRPNYEFTEVPFTGR